MPYKNREKQKEYQRNWVQSRRRDALQYLGGKCAHCGVTANLEIDHVNPTEKEFTMGNLLSRRWEVVLAELDKCQILCSDCHKQKTRSDGCHNILRGEEIGTSKLTSDNVRVIRRLLKNGLTQQEIGLQFGVDKATINKISRRETWTHIP